MKVLRWKGAADAGALGQLDFTAMLRVGERWTRGAIGGEIGTNKA